MSDIKYKVIVGLEIHVQLATRTKMFCGCALSFGEEPNSRVCPVCMGMPGSLPVMNKKAVEYSALAGLALNCRIAGFTKWDRKSYYYPDLPKNYQISQYDLPLCSDGFIEVGGEDGKPKRIRIRRAHLEEDAGKNMHTASFSQVDLNRAGTPLLEIVTEPDMNSAAEVRSLAVELQRIVRYLGISEANMQQGHMRFEPNINLVIEKGGQEYKTAIVEVKNLNSFRSLERSVEYEITRQLDDFLETGRTMQMGNKSTRGWDDANQVTVLQREKEEAHDYRYFPDPDLVPVEMSKADIERIKANLCELPLQRQTRYVAEFGLSNYDAGVLTADKATSDFFEEAVKLKGDAKRVCNWITQHGLRLANQKGCSIADIGITPDKVVQMTEMVELGDISSTAVTSITNLMVETWPNMDPRLIAEKKNLLQKSDAGELELIVDKVIAANPQAVEDAKSGGKKTKKAHGFLLGQVMQKTKGQANPKIVSEIMAKKLS